jgi:hypothetical protein
VIDSRFNGFPGIALGGYAGGVLSLAHAKAEVTFHRPVRLGKPYQTATGQDGAEILQDGNDILAVGREAFMGVQAPPSVGLESSKIASSHYLGHAFHPYPTCFNCGPGRPEGDGLRIFPGPVGKRKLVAAPWTPSSSLANSNGVVRSEFIWSALDCPTIWALIHAGKPDTEERAVTSSLAVELISSVRVGQPHIVMGWKVGETGRTRVAGGAIYSSNGQLLATARHTMVTTDWGVPMGLNYWLYG